jgi:hypothetical protein
VIVFKVVAAIALGWVRSCGSSIALVHSLKWLGQFEKMLEPAKMESLEMFRDMVCMRGSAMLDCPPQYLYSAVGSYATSAALLRLIRDAVGLQRSVSICWRNSSMKESHDNTTLITGTNRRV